MSAVLLAACVSAPGTSDPSSSSSSEETGGNGAGTSSGESQPIATAAYHASTEKHLRFDLIALERLNDDMAVLAMTVTNEGNEKAFVMHSLAEVDGQASTPDGVSLIDTANQKRYMPLKLADGTSCHCSSWRGNESLDPGEVIRTWVTFPAPPPEVDTMTVTTPVTPDFLDVPITQVTEDREEITAVAVAEPRILDIGAFQDDPESGTSRLESGDTTQVMLSSDVLFELNESELTPEAESVLKDVAEEIDASSATTVRIDGYTDNTGNDSINIPLSEARAESVREALEELTTRDGIEFETAGHGSSNPVGNNDTEEGRKKNRRVTVTFAK
ncbi:OmpA family protein [Thermobifida alba]|nr:OmpA family protein [Thermobifida alba]